jgi:hypothetical protein
MGESGRHRRRHHWRMADERHHPLAEGRTALADLRPRHLQLTQEQLDKLLKVTKAANGNIYWIDPAVIDPATGRAVGADNLNNTAGFAGQVFFNPMAGEVGNLRMLQFDRPSVASFDAAIAKQFKITKRVRFELKGELLNAFNAVFFNAGDYDINSTQFGRITGVAVGARVVQLSGRFEF